MKEEEARQMMATLELFHGQLESLAGDQKVIQLSLEETIRAKETLRRYKDADEGSEILVPVGGGSFVYAKISSRDRVLLELGSGVTAEKSIDDAVETMEERIKELNETAKTVSSRRGQLEAENARLTQKLQEAYQTLQRGP